MNVSLRLNRESLRKGMMGLVGEIVKSEMAEVRKAVKSQETKNEYVKGKSESRITRMKG